MSKTCLNSKLFQIDVIVSARSKCSNFVRGGLGPIWSDGGGNTNAREKSIIDWSIKNVRYFVRLIFAD